MMTLLIINGKMVWGISSCKVWHFTQQSASFHAVNCLRLYFKMFHLLNPFILITKSFKSILLVGYLAFFVLSL